MAEGLLRLFRWAGRTIGVRPAFEWALLLCLTLALLAGLGQVVAHLDVGGLLPLCLLALLCGWLLGRSRLDGGWAALAAVLLGAVVIIGGAAQTLSRAGSLLREIILFCSGWLQWLRGSAFPDRSGVTQAWEKVISGLAVVLGRLVGWSSDLLHRQPSFDQVASYLVWSLAIWLVLFWAAWALRRRREPFQSILPAAALLATSLAVARGQTWSLVATLGVIFVLLAWTHYRTKLESWQSERIDFVEDIPFSLSISTFALVTVLLVSASAAPALRIERIRNSFRQLWEETRPNAGGNTVVPGSGSSRPKPTEAKSFGASLGLEMKKPAAPADFFRDAPVGGLPRQHLLGSGQELAQREVFRIQVKPVSPDESQLPSSARYYWRALTYDLYTGRGWSSRPVQELHYPANQPVSSASLPGQRLVVQEVQSVAPALGLKGLYISAGEPVSIDKDFVVAWRYRTDATGEASDVFGASAAASEGEDLARTYQATSLVSFVGSEQLRKAGTDYPAQVRARFLELPKDLPARVYQLARNLIAPELTPYDQAIAIESYLRTFPYTLDTGVPPVGRDVVDYFLFDLKRGYCDYYASAMVVLARAAGIPARLAMGYASGKYDPQSQRYTVTEADAHSWPELYFPGYGWIGFEPTASQPALERASTAADLAPPQIPQPPELPGFVLKLDWGRLGMLAVSGVLVILIGWLAWVLSEPWRLRMLTPQGCLRRIYSEIVQYGEQLRAWEGAGHTPNEVAGAISQRLMKPQNGVLEMRFPTRFQEDLALITDLYNRELYSPQPAGQLEQSLAVAAWGRMRFWFWRANLVARVAFPSLPHKRQK